MQWRFTTVDSSQVDRLAQASGISPRLAEVLIKRGVTTVAAVRSFMSPLLSTLDDPYNITHLPAAIDRIILAMARREAVMVFGDYDVDGVTSTTLLVSLLSRFGLSPLPLVPRRLEEGYGLSLSAIDRALGDSATIPGLFIAVDCGTNSVAEVDYLRAKGIDVIIIDHHTGKTTLPNAILINPHVHDGPDVPWKNLCTVGLVFKLAHGLLKKLRSTGDQIAQEIDIKDYLDLVAVGTIADMVPLRGENRIIARAGLERLPNTTRLGLSALFEVSGIRQGEPLRPYDISFRLGPRINASGRLADASLPIQMLLSADEKFCRAAAAQLDGYNKERQEIEKAIYEAALAQVQPDRAGHVLYSADWHPGVVGVVASRLTHDLHRPCIVLGGEGEYAKGSGRSVEGVNLVEVLGDCREQLRSWGGHPMAVGVSLLPVHIDTFRSAFDAGVRTRLAGRDPQKTINITATLQPSEVNGTLLADLEALHPHGIENPVPIFALMGVRLAETPQTFGDTGKHFRFSILIDGKPVWGVAWGKAQNMPPAGQPIDIAFELAWNAWKGRKYLQMTLIDWRVAQA